MPRKLKNPTNAEQADIRYAPQAEEDLLRIHAYIAVNNPLRAQQFIEKLLAEVHTIAVFPQGYPAAPEGLIDGEISRHCCSVYPYRIVYIVDEYGLNILGFRHGSRQPGLGQ
jgi:plasmid stabilization system protein ParE